MALTLSVSKRLAGSFEAQGECVVIALSRKRERGNDG
jgi:hypothetical protein